MSEEAEIPFGYSFGILNSDFLPPESVRSFYREPIRERYCFRGFPIEVGTRQKPLGTIIFSLTIFCPGTNSWVVLSEDIGLDEIKSLLINTIDGLIGKNRKIKWTHV